MNKILASDIINTVTFVENIVLKKKYYKAYSIFLYNLVEELDLVLKGTSCIVNFNNSIFKFKGTIVAVQISSLYGLTYKVIEDGRSSNTYNHVHPLKIKFI